MLDGKAEVFNYNDQVIDTLWVGDYIGDSMILYAEYESTEEYSVRCKSLCQVGVISGYYMNRLFESYPEWSDFFE